MKSVLQVMLLLLGQVVGHRTAVQFWLYRHVTFPLVIHQDVLLMEFFLH